MTTKHSVRGGTAVAASLSLFVLGACGGQPVNSSGVAGDVAVDGSSTVAPLTESAAVEFAAVEPGINVTVATSGTGGGFEAFCNGETDISDASRPIKDEEVQACAEAGIEFTEVVVANDGLSVVVHPENDWAPCLTTEQLNLMWAPEAEGVVTRWNQVDPSFPDQELVLYGPGTDSGTFDYFTEVINGESGSSRADYSASEDDNVLVQGVAGDQGGLGYFGLSYAEENADILTLVQIDSGDGCVSPTVETVQSGEYSPLARPLFIYVNNGSYVDKPEVRAFVDFYVANFDTIAEAVGMVPLTEAQALLAQDELASLG